MSRKRYYSLVRCLCAMLCCITFLVTSLTTEAATGDILYSGNSNSWWCNSLEPVGTSGSLVNGTYHFQITWQFGIPESYFENYSSKFIQLDFSNLYVPFSQGSQPYGISTQFVWDSESGIFMNGNRVGAWSTPMSSDFVQYYTQNSNGTIINNPNTYIHFSYIRDCSVICSLDDAFYLNGVYYFRPTFRVGCNGNPSSYNICSPSGNGTSFRPNTSSTFTWKTPNTFPLGLVTVKETNKRPVYTINTSDSGTQNAIDNQTSKVEQGNQIAEQGNTIAQENSDTNKDTNNKITNFFNSFFDNLIHIFVPEDGFFSQWFSDLNTFMSQKLGFLWSPFDFLISFLNGIYSGSGSASLVFPELAWIDGTVIIPRTEFSFDNIGGQSFSDLRDKIYFGTDVILLGAVISQFYKKIKLVFEGGGD